MHETHCLINRILNVHLSIILLHKEGKRHRNVEKNPGSSEAFSLAMSLPALSIVQAFAKSVFSLKPDLIGLIFSSLFIFSL